MPDQNTAALSTSSEQNLITQVTVATVGRLLINTSRRFVYPFAPALSRGLGVPLTAITSLIAINQLTGIMSPLFGPVSDRLGYRTMMLSGLGLVAIGLLAGGLIPLYIAVLIAMFLAGLGKSIFDPAMQAYIGERVPYQKRGMVIGLIEISWAGSSLVGIPVAGYLIAYLGWRAPFLVFGGLTLLVVALLGLVLPREQRRRDTASTLNFIAAWSWLRRERTAVGFLGYGFLVSLANDNLFVILGAWLENSFALGLVALGTATTVIGFAELGGELLTSTVSDRIGLKRITLTTLALTAFAYALLPLMSQRLTLALIGLFVVFLVFEFMIVTSISLGTEVLPQARATMMALYLAVAGLGRVVGALIGGPVWLNAGLLGIGLTSAAVSLLAFLLLWWGLRNWQGS